MKFTKKMVAPLIGVVTAASILASSTFVMANTPGFSKTLPEDGAEHITVAAGRKDDADETNAYVFFNRESSGSAYLWIDGSRAGNQISDDVTVYPGQEETVPYHDSAVGWSGYTMLRASNTEENGRWISGWVNFG